MLNFLRKFLSYIIKCFRYEPRSFGWLCLGLYFFLSCGSLFAGLHLPSSSTSQVVIEQVRAGGQKPTFVRGGKKFDLTFHRMLEKKFPDWQARIDYQKKQEILYRSAMLKQREVRRLRIITDPSELYTKEEKDAVDYFQGKGFYRDQQDPSKKPNIYDTRQSFLLKMHDPKLRNDFLSTFNRLNNK